MSKVKAIPHVVYNINYHLVWIPKYRESILRGGMKERLKEILSEIAKQYEFEIEGMSIQTDDVHLFVSAPPKYSPASLADILKNLIEKSRSTFKNNLSLFSKISFLKILHSLL